MSMNSPRRAQSNKKPRGGGSYHYRPKARNGSGGNANNQGGKNNGGQQHSKYRDLKAPPGIDSGPSDDGGPPDSDDKHHSLAKPRSRYDRYDRFGSTSPKLSPKFGGQRQGNRRGNNANSDRPRENRQRGSGRSKFSGRAPYDDDDVEEESTSFGRRSARNHRKQHGDRGGYRYRQGDRDMNRDDRRDGDSGGKWDDSRDYQSGRDRSRYYPDMGDRGQHYGRPRTQNPHSRVPQPPVLDNLINIFHEYHNDTTDMTDDTAVVPPPSANDGTHVYPIDWLMLQRKKPQHKTWPGPTLPDLVNRNLNPTPPPDESSGRYGSHKETNIRPHSEIPSTGSWRTPKFGSRSREDPPKTDLADPGDDSKPRRGAPIKPPIHNSGSGRTVEDLEAVAARARETSEDENPEQQQTTETHQPKERRKHHETPEWDSAGAPQDMWGAYTFGKLDRNKDLQNLNETGQLLDVDQVVVREKQKEQTENPQEKQPQRKNESKTWKAEMDEDEASDPEVVQKQIEEMNLADEDEEFASGGGSGPNYGGLGIGLGVEQPDISGFKTNPWGKLLPPQDPSNSKTSSADAVELNIDSVLDEFRYGTSGDVSEPSPEKRQETSPRSDGAAASKTRSPTSNEPPTDTQNTPDEVTTPGQGEPSVVSTVNPGGEGNGNAKQPQQQPTEEQFRWYEEKARRYYYQSVLFHQKYKKYERLYIEANEVMMADPSRRDPHMEKYVEKYQQYRQRFHLVYDKYRRYKHFLENYGRKISVHQQPHEYGQAYHGAPYGGPEHGGPSGHGQPIYHDPNRHRFPPGPYGEPGRGGDPRDPRFMYYQQQEYYHGRRPGYPQESGEPYYDPRDPRRGDPHDPRSRGPPGPYVGVPPHGPHGPPRGGPPRGPPPRGRDELYDPGMYGGPYPHLPRMPKPQPHVPGSSALKIEKPPRSASQPNMEDDTKTTPADNSGKKESNGEAVPGTSQKPTGTEKDPGAQPGTDENFMAHLMLGDTHGRGAAPNGGDEPSTNAHFPQGSGGQQQHGADYNEPPEYPPSFYRSGVAPRDETSRGGGIDLSDLGYTTAPSSRRERDPRREQMMSGMVHSRGGPDPMDGRNRAVQYADDYARYYSKSSGGGMTRSEFEEYEQQQQQQKKRRHYLEHYRQFGYYPGGNPPPPHPRMHGPGGHHPRHEGSPPGRQPSPGNPEYYPGYPPAGRYEQPNYGYGPQGDYPPQYYRGQYDE